MKTFYDKDGNVLGTFLEQGDTSGGTSTHLYQHNIKINDTESRLVLTIFTNNQTQFDYDSLLAFLKTNFTISIDESGEDPIVTGNFYTLGVKGEYLDNNNQKDVNCVFAIMDSYEEYLIMFSKLNAYDLLSIANRIDFYKDDYPTITDNVVQVF